MVWEEIPIGFTIAGFVAVAVPGSWWASIFLLDLQGELPSWLIVVENALVAPFVATFIGSMGNIPLATVLNATGVLFAGIMGLIYPDLLVPPLVAINAKYQGWRVALYIAGVMYASAAITAVVPGEPSPSLDRDLGRTGRVERLPGQLTKLVRLDDHDGGALLEVVLRDLLPALPVAHTQQAPDGHADRPHCEHCPERPDDSSQAEDSGTDRTVHAGAHRDRDQEPRERTDAGSDERTLESARLVLDRNLTPPLAGRARDEHPDRVGWNALFREPLHRAGDSLVMMEHGFDSGRSAGCRGGSRNGCGAHHGHLTF